MKFTGKQLDDLSRVLGTVGSSAIIGSAVAIFRPEQFARLEVAALIVSALLLLSAMFYVQRGR